MNFLINLDSLFVLTGVGYVLAAFLSDRIADRRIYRQGLAVYLAAVFVGHVMPGIYEIGMWMAIVCVPVGWILELVSLRRLCVSLSARRKEPEKNPANS